MSNLLANAGRSAGSTQDLTPNTTHDHAATTARRATAAERNVAIPTVGVPTLSQVPPARMTAMAVAIDPLPHPAPARAALTMVRFAAAGRSINDFIPRDAFSLQYTSVDDAVRMLTCLGKGAHMAKVDLKSAFRMVPVHPLDWELLGMQWKVTTTWTPASHLAYGRPPSSLLVCLFVCLFVCLCFQVASALEWILRHNYSLHSLIHYLDDFFLAGPPNSPCCGEKLQCFLQVAATLGTQVAMEKVDGPSTVLVFLGLILDSLRQEIQLPPEKLQDMLQELEQWLAKCNTTKQELLSLIGKLSFAARAVPAGRLFLRLLIHLSTSATKLHHHIRLTADARADIHWWHSFLPSWNGTAKFLDPTPTATADMDLFTDAAGMLGCGAYYKGAWFHYAWQPHQAVHSIQWKELFAIVAAVLTWGHLWHGRRIRLHCDNEAIVLAWKHQCACHPHLMTLLGLLFLTAVPLFMLPIHLVDLPCSLTQIIGNFHHTCSCNASDRPLGGSALGSALWAILSRPIL